MTTLAEKSKLTVDGLLASRHEARTYEQKVRHALDVVEMHLQEENPDRIDECIRLTPMTRFGKRRRARFHMRGAN